jgi:ketosteroid isomerase-like protein
MKKLFVLFWLTASFTVPAVWANPQKQQKTNGQAPPLVFASVAEEIDHDIGEMLGAWQVGDVEAMHKYYADDATWVRGSDDPPITGWQIYIQQYLQQRKDLSGVQLIRKNTNIFHYGDTAWACYQWEFLGLVQGKPTTARGQTTLFFVKQGDHWLIVHNHTSQICPGT